MRITIFAVLRDFEVPESMPLSAVHDEVYRSLGDTAEAQRQARNVYIVRCRNNTDGSPATFQEFDRAPPLNQCIREAMEHYSLAHGLEIPNIYCGVLVNYDSLSVSQHATLQVRDLSGPQLHFAPGRPAGLHPSLSTYPVTGALQPHPLHRPGRSTHRRTGSDTGNDGGARSSDTSRSVSHPGPLRNQASPSKRARVDTDNTVRGESRLPAASSIHPLLQASRARASLAPITSEPSRASTTVAKEDQGQRQRSVQRPPVERNLLIQHLRQHIPIMTALLRRFEPLPDGQSSAPTVPEDQQREESGGDHAPSGQQEGPDGQQGEQEHQPVVTEAEPSVHTSQEAKGPETVRDGDGAQA